MSNERENAAIVGVGGAVCAVCCAGPILGFLAAVGLGGIVAFALFGTIGLAVAVIVGVVLFRRRRRRALPCTPRDDTVSLAPPAVRTSR